MPDMGAIGVTSRIAVVHLWCARLDAVDALSLERYTAWFTSAERAQFSGFRSERRRREFIVGRGLARLALAREASEAPESFEFEAGPHGKLSTKVPPSARSVHFNISHTADFVACATCNEFPIGLDVERVADRVEPTLIARRFFSESEANKLDELNEAARLDRFFKIWTLKEALAKAYGMGLGVPLDASEFEFSKDDSLKATSSHPQFDQGATLALTSPTPQHRLALCVLCDEATALQVAVHQSQLCAHEFAGELEWTLVRLRNSTFKLDGTSPSRQPLGHAS